MPERRRLFIAVLILLWIVAVVISTYYVTKPASPNNVLVFFSALADLLVVGWLAAIGGGIGLVILGKDRPSGQAETIAWSTGLGLGILSLFMLGLAAVGGIRPWLVWLLLLAATFVLRRELTAWLKLVGSLTDRFIPPREYRVWQIYVIVAFGLALPIALLPPTAWDALVYHLTGPKLTIQAGHLVHSIDLPYLGFPQLGEMLFTLLMLLRRPETTQLVSLLFGCLTALACYSLVARRWGRAAGISAVAVLFSAISIVLLLSRPYVDIILMFYTLACFASLLNGLSTGSKRWILIAGLFAGMAMSAKYTAAAVPVGAALVFLVFDRPRRWRLLLIFCGSALVFTLPWLVKNWVLTGNPVYPFLITGRYWDHYRAWWYSRGGTGLASTDLVQLILAPWFATVWGVEGGGNFSASIGPLFLALTPLALITWRFQDSAQRKLLLLSALFAAPSCALWLVGIGSSALLIQTRLLFPIFPFFAFFAAASASKLSCLNPRQLKLDWVVQAIIVFVLLLNVVDLGLEFIQRRPFEVLSGTLSSEEYLTGQLGWHYEAMKTINELGPDAKVLFLWEPRSFYCQVECWPDALLDRWWRLRQTTGSPSDIARQWRAEGFTHVLLFNKGYQLILAEAFDPISPADQTALQELLDGQLVLEKDLGGVYSLYRFR